MKSLRSILLAGSAVALLSGCAVNQAAEAVADGQLVCQAGPTVVAMFDTNAAAVLAKGTPKKVVDAVCATIGGIAISPPGPGQTVGHVTVNLPAIVLSTKS